MLIFLIFELIHARYWPDLPILIFPDEVPGEDRNVQEKWFTFEKIGNSTTVHVSNVTKPTITVYRPDESIKNGSAVIVMPGGGFNILAIDLEGEEICDWLRGLGITAVLLKYRVSGEGSQRSLSALQDAQRAVSYLRAHAEEYNLDPRKIGVLGFSAGGHLSATLSNYFESRTYDPIDDADKASCRPDFTVLVYPAMLSGDLFQLAPNFTINSNAPPTFIIQAENDKECIDTGIFYYYALKQANIPATLHLYDSGGHGFGLRDTGASSNEWTQRAENWFEEIGVIHQ